MWPFDMDLRAATLQVFPRAYTASITQLGKPGMGMNVIIHFRYPIWNKTMEATRKSHKLICIRHKTSHALLINQCVTRLFHEAFSMDMPRNSPFHPFQYLNPVLFYHLFYYMRIPHPLKIGVDRAQLQVHLHDF